MDKNFKAIINIQHSDIHKN